MTRATNQELCDEFRKLLTEGASASLMKVHDACEKNAPYPPLLVNLLGITKPWRGELWAKFAEIERRLCPQPPE